MTKAQSIIQHVLVLILILLCGRVCIGVAPGPSRNETDSIRRAISAMTDKNEILQASLYILRNHPIIDTMLKYGLVACDVAKEFGDSVTLGEAYMRVGWCYNVKDEYHTAGQYYQRASMIFSSANINDRLNNARAISGMGDVHIYVGDFEAGLSLKLSALKEFEERQSLKDCSMIYRSMASSCREYQQYSLALEYLDRALRYDLETGDSLFIGRDYYQLGKTINEYAHGDEYECKQVAKAYLLKGLEYHNKTGDNLYVALSCMQLSMIYCDLLADTEFWNFADSSIYYYNIGKNITDEIGYGHLRSNYKIAHAEHLVISGHNIEALALLSSIKYNTKLPGSTRISLYHAYNFYYHYHNDYKGIYELKRDEELFRKRMYISEFDTKITQISQRANLENSVRKFDIDSVKRELRLKKQHTVVIMIAIGFSVLLTVALILIVILVRNNKINEILRSQTEEKKTANEELLALTTEICEQSVLIEKQTRQMKRQRDKLAAYNLKIVLNLEIGSRFQLSVLPTEANLKKMFKQIFVIWKPLEEVSGDFYWATETLGLKLVAVADCTGHGIPGAALSMLGISFLNGIVAKVNLQTSAADVLTMLRRKIEEAFGNDDGIHDGMDIAVCIIDTDRQRLSYAGAYRPLWLYRNGNLIEYKGDKIPVAIDTDRNQPFSDNEISLEKGDKFYMFSDGITDQIGIKTDSKTSKFKHKRLRDLLAKINSYDADTQKNEIESTLDMWKGRLEQTDDMILMGITEI